MALRLPPMKFHHGFILNANISPDSRSAAAAERRRRSQSLNVINILLLSRFHLSATSAARREAGLLEPSLNQLRVGEIKLITGRERACVWKRESGGVCWLRLFASSYYTLLAVLDKKPQSLSRP